MDFTHLLARRETLKVLREETRARLSAIVEERIAREEARERRRQEITALASLAISR
jgi:hypothetical protein